MTNRGVKRQGDKFTSAKTLFIFIFPGESGVKYEYKNRWDKDVIFTYVCDEGQ